MLNFRLKFVSLPQRCCVHRVAPFILCFTSAFVYFQTVDGYKKKFTRFVLQDIKRSSIAFDTVWLLALSLNRSLDDAVKMQALNISDRKEMNVYFRLLDQLRMRMMSMDFEGISVGMTTSE